MLYCYGCFFSNASPLDDLANTDTFSLPISNFPPKSSHLASELNTKYSKFNETKATFQSNLL